MVELRPTLFVCGILLATLGCAMMIPALYDLARGDRDWVAFAASACLTLFVGVSLVFANWSVSRDNLTIKQAFLLTTASWLVLAAFSAVPFTWSRVDLSFADAFFEAMSGLTTTGATVMTKLDEAPRGILLWRALLQWMGGVGIIVTAIAVLPMLQVGGMQLFHMESSDRSDDILPRAGQIAGSIARVYLGLTVACFLCYALAGMSPFDAVTHAMTTLATGGFSTHDSSMGYFKSQAIETIAIVFMILGGMPFLLLVQVMTGRPLLLLRDTQIRWYLAILACLVVAAWLSQGRGGHEVGSLELRDAAFSVVSVITGTGFATVPYDLWGPFAVGLFFFMMFIGGCAGSASCGIKIFRVQVLFGAIRHRLETFAQPHRVAVAKYNGRPMDPSVSRAVMSFLFVYALSLMIVSYALTLFGLDTLSALSAAGTTLSNVGPGLGERVGPASNFKDLADGAKWILSAAMLLGRLEFFTVLVLFMPAFWRS